MNIQSLCTVDAMAVGSAREGCGEGCAHHGPMLAVTNNYMIRFDYSTKTIQMTIHQWDTKTNHYSKSM